MAENEVPQVRFKHEDEVDGIPIGPVIVRDPDGSEGSPSDWVTKPQALEIARRLGVELGEA